MLVISASNDLMTPDKEGAGEEARVFLKAGLERHRLVDLVLLLAFLLHKKYLNIIRF
jgi:hypothetical protein